MRKVAAVTVVTICGVAMIAFGLMANEVAVARYVSADGVLETSTIWTIRAFDAVMILGGIIALAKKSKIVSYPEHAIGVVICGVYALIAFQTWLDQPLYNWDLLGYIGCAISYDQTDVEAIHRETYAEIRSIPKKPQDLLLSAMPYRMDMASNAEHFHQQLPFYHVKPLYVSLIYLLHKAGVSYLNAMVAISAVASVLIFVVIAYWLTSFTHGILWGLCVILLMNAVGLTDEAARLATPDALSALLIISSLFLLVEQKQSLASYLVLIVSILVRPDNVILAALLMCVVNVASPAEYRLSTRRVVVLLLLAASVCSAVNFWAGSYGWWTLFHHTFIGNLRTPREFSEPLSVARYASVLGARSQNLLFQKTMSFFALLFLLMVAKAARRVGLSGSHLPVAMAMVGTVAAHFLLFPEWEDRFFVAYYAVGGVLFIAMLHRMIEAGMNGMSQGPNLRG